MLRKLVLFVCFLYVAFHCIRAGWNTEAPTDIFVSSAFYLEPDGNSDEHTVRLIAMAPHSADFPPIFCSNPEGERVEAKVEKMGGAKACRWWDVLIDCTFRTPASRLRLGETNEIEMPVRHSNEQKYAVVVCFARLFTYENWRVALTAIELYVHHGVDFLHLPVVSVLRDLHTIFAHYEQLGIVRLADGVVPPSPINGEDPNRETEFFNQIVANTECLYEYRRSDFVIFADLDDVLVPRRFRSIHEELLASSQRFPQAASFEFMRNAGTRIKFARDPKEFNLTDTLTHISFRGLGVHVPGKSAVMPRRTRLGLMHRPGAAWFETKAWTELEDGFEHVQLDEHDANFLHMRVYMFGSNWTYPLDSYVTDNDYSGVQAVFSKRIEGNSTVKRAFHALPHREFHYEALEACYKDIGVRLLQRGVSGAFCPNPLNCAPPSSSRSPPCIRQQSEFEEMRGKADMQTTVKQIGQDIVQIEFPAASNSCVEYGSFVPIATPKNLVLFLTHSCQLRGPHWTSGNLKIRVVEFKEHPSVCLSAMFVLKNASGGFIGKGVLSGPIEFTPDAPTHYLSPPPGEYNDKVGWCCCQVVLCFLSDAVEKPAEKPLPKVVEGGHLHTSLIKMMNDKELGDVQFECEGQAFKVRKLFLQAQSDVFDAMFTHDSKEKQRGVIEIKDATAATVERLVRYLYTGRVEKPKDVAADLLPLAVKYQLHELTAICVNALDSSLSLANIIERLELVALYDHPDAFKLRVLTFTKQNYEAVRKLPEWPPFVARNGPLICELMELRF